MTINTYGVSADKRAHRYCVIMCGGIGSRFWPYSREARPKQFIDFFGTGRSLLQMTYDRMLSVVPPENIVVVTNEGYADEITRQLPDIGADNLLLEPARRNTAPCVAWAMHHIAARDPEASVAVTASDHLITREPEFHRAMLDGLDYVEQTPALLTLGIKPTRPETGYGYIQVGEHLTGNISRVKTFTEKPNREMAEMFIATGEFFWNSGIFLWRVDTILKAFAEHAPEIEAIFSEGLEAFGTAGESDFIAGCFPRCPSISVDYAVMEKASNVCCETVSFGWSDLGTWSSLYDNSPRNAAGNVTQNCKVLAYNSTGNIFAVDNPDKLVVVDGLQDYIVADAGDVLLICPKANEQSIKQMVNDVKVKYGNQHL